VPPVGSDGTRGKMNKVTPGHHLREVLEGFGLSKLGLGWYECTRHTFVSQLVKAGRSIFRLSKLSATPR
jgi:hypothetical protein